MKLIRATVRAYPCRLSSLSMVWLCFCLFLCAGTLHAQDFTVAATPTHETCPGNGVLTLSVQNADPNASVNYEVYKLPNTTTPIFDSSGTTVPGLHDGVYYIVATQVVNGNPVEDTLQVTIEDQTTPLTYYITSENAMCGPDGTITVTTATGTPVTYEIIAGPTTRAPQASNIFQNIPAGTFSIRVTDNCGTGIVITHVVLSDANTLVISGPMFPDTELPGCDLITLAIDAVPEFPEIPAQTPLTAVITLYPPDGTGPLVYTQTVNNLADGPDVYQVIPFYEGVPYYYDLEVTDACGTVYNIEDNLINQSFQGIGFVGDAGCPGKYLEISLIKYVGPYTIVFTDHPEDFDPNMNPLHPGPFTAPVTAYGSEADDIAVPYGSYTFTITDACGRTSTKTLEVEESEVFPTVSTFPTSCLNDLGGVEVNVPGFEIVEAYIEQAPLEYPFDITHDVTSYIDTEHKLAMEDMLPQGDYTVRVIDECGREFTEDFTIGVGSSIGVNANVRVDCATGLGSVKVFSNTLVTKVVMTQAPAAYTATQTLPYDISFNISDEDGACYMNGLPPGSYKFKVDDACVTNYEIQKTLGAYNTTTNELTVTRHCGSFDLYLEHVSTSIIFLFYGLQVEMSPGQWGNPATGIPYEEGTELNPTNAYQITANTNLYNLTFTGKFRIVKSFGTFGTGRADDAVPNVPKCMEVIHEFEFFDDLQLISIVSLTCSGDMADIQVNAQGAEPINYSIVSKNGEPFLIDNGTNNIFSGLESADYVVYFEDPCGNFITQPFSIADLPSMVMATPPGDMDACDDLNDGTETFDLNLQDAAILDGQDAATFVVTYHATVGDAEAGINPLPLSYETPSTTIYARVINTLNTLCHAVTEFNVVVLPEPVLLMDDSYSICEGESITILADPGFAPYIWDGVVGGQTLIVTQGGTHTLTVTNQFGCETTKNIIVSASQAPQIAYINIEDWDETDNTITVIVEDSPSAPYFEYSLDGDTYQASNVFTGLPPGPYTVYVRDIYDCGMDEGDVYLLTYPKFFTPNGDGINDIWRIQFSYLEPNMLIYIYDRFGKVVSSFDANGIGWDGTLNGYRLPATDYWFVVKRQDGKEYKGHFSMMR